MLLGNSSHVASIPLATDLSCTVQDKSLSIHPTSQSSPVTGSIPGSCMGSYEGGTRVLWSPVPQNARSAGLVKSPILEKPPLLRDDIYLGQGGPTNIAPNIEVVLTSPTVPRGEATFGSPLLRQSTSLSNHKSPQVPEKPEFADKNQTITSEKHLNVINSPVLARNQRTCFMGSPLFSPNQWSVPSPVDCEGSSPYAERTCSVFSSPQIEGGEGLLLGLSPPQSPYLEVPGNPVSSLRQKVPGDLGSSTNSHRITGVRMPGALGSCMSSPGSPVIKMFNNPGSNLRQSVPANVGSCLSPPESPVGSGISLLQSSSIRRSVNPGSAANIHEVYGSCLSPPKSPLQSDIHWLQSPSILVPDNVGSNLRQIVHGNVGSSLQSVPGNPGFSLDSVPGNLGPQRPKLQKRSLMSSTSAPSAKSRKCSYSNNNLGSPSQVAR